MNDLKKYLKTYRRDCVLAPLFKMLEALFDLFVPIVVAAMIDRGIGRGDHSLIIRLSFLLVLLALAGLALSFLAQFFAARAATGITADLRHDLFARILSLGAPKADRIGAGTLITRMSSDLNQVQNGINLFLRLFLRSPFIVFGAMIMAFTIDSSIAIVFAVTIPVLSVIIFGIMHLTSSRFKKIQGMLDKLTTLTRENLTGVRVVRAFGMETKEKARFREANRDLVTGQLRTGRISALLNPLTYVAVNLGIVAIIGWGSRFVDRGILLSGEVIALVNYMSQILVELVKLANLIVQCTRALASMDRVAEILEMDPSISFAHTERIPVTCSEETVRFDHVSAAYEDAGKEALTDISFTAYRGETIGIIGGTGSGKSTLVRLIPRLYEASSGSVHICSRPVEDYPRQQLRSMIGYVPQKSQLFSGTIRSNLLWGDPKASDEQLWTALRNAQAEEFVRSKPGGLDEEVEQGGRNFSGGQRQRLTIARALVCGGPILILDDSSSALDYATDALLRAALKEISSQMTVFIVSQRTASIQHADRILVLDDGKLAGMGTHEELLDHCPLYLEIYESQFRKEGKVS